MRSPHRPMTALIATLALSPLLLWPVQAQSGAGPEGPDPAATCPQAPRVEAQGLLSWGADRQDGQNAPYDLNCPELHLSSDGRAVTVRAATLDAAIAAFTEDAFFMSYYADLRVHILPDGTVTADPVRDVPFSDLDALFRATITVTPQGGAPHLLMKNALINPVTIPAGTAFTVEFNLPGLPTPWPKVTFDPASGTVQAVIGTDG